MRSFLERLQMKWLESFDTANRCAWNSLTLVEATTAGTTDLWFRRFAGEWQLM